MPKVIVSIVCYNTSLGVISKCIESVEAQDVDWMGVFVDHSLDSKYKELISNRKNWNYLERGNINDGFGGGNNFALSNIDDSEYYLVMNPDLYLQSNAISQLLLEIQGDSKIGLVTGKISYPNGSLQKLNKRDPKVFALLGRRFPRFQILPFISNSIQRYEMMDMDYNERTEIEFISGCLMLISAKAWHLVKGFDHRYFLYFEDADLTRKLRNHGYKTMYTPFAEAVHEYQRGSHKSLFLFLIFLKSMLKYFMKWGWAWR